MITQASPPDAVALATVRVALVIELRSIFFCLDDLNRPAIVAGGDKLVWAIVIVVGGPVEQTAHWLYGHGPY